MRKIPGTLIPFLFFATVSCSQKNTTDTANKNELEVGGACEGCEAIMESAVAFYELKHNCYLPDWNTDGQKLEVSGIVYQPDGITPAADVIIYVYHTDQTGIYPKKGDEKGWGKRHGYLRGWMKTNEKGEYKFFTLKPASYPDSKISAHIHVTLKETGKSPYWIDEFLFEDDPFLTEKERQNPKPRGGPGIITLLKKGNVLVAERDIVLGLNVPGYR